MTADCGPSGRGDSNDDEGIESWPDENARFKLVLLSTSLRSSPLCNNINI